LENTVIVGIDWLKTREDIENTTVFFGVPSTGTFDLEKRNIGWYVHDEFRPLNAFSLSAGYRRDRSEFSFAQGSPGEITLDEDLFTLGVSYRLMEQGRIYASYARSFRYPVLDELFNFFTNTVDTGLVPRLPTTSRSGSAGGFHRWFPWICTFSGWTQRMKFFMTRLPLPIKIWTEKHGVTGLRSAST
jgi:outer membrane receptor protein involved in Fe transport